VQEIAKAAPASAHVVKAFNTVLGHVLAKGRPLDVLFAGDDARAKESVSAHITSVDLRDEKNSPSTYTHKEQ
jgi:8-hydroxy-5-deazaflavin:NADPH oxidoreductase